MEENDEQPPFWSQSQKDTYFYPPPPPSSDIRPWVLVLLASIFVILFIHSFLSSNFGGFRPSLLKNGWDTLNLALVVFAVICGLLGRDVASGGGGSGGDGEKMVAPPPSLLRQSQGSAVHLRDPEQSVYQANKTMGIRGMRSSNSYPDLRQELHAGDDLGIAANWRFADDIQLYRRGQPYIRELGSLDEPIVKTIQVGSDVLTKAHSRSASTPEMPTPSLSPIPAGADATRPPPPPPPPPPLHQKQKLKGHRKRSGASAKDIATAIAQFYSKKKRRSKAKKIHDDELLPPASLFTPPPPPPLPPLPSSVFSQIFTQRKGRSKSKRFNSVSAKQFSPPAPPPPPTFFHSKQKGSLVSDSPVPPSLSIQQPPRPPPAPPTPLTPPLAPRKKKEKRTALLRTYRMAPPSPLPPPPPPPPPPTDDNDSYAKLGGEGISSPFCPSPDVNNKADMFIMRFREGLKLEKLNSIRKKQQTQQDPPQEQPQEAGTEMEMEQEIMSMMMMGLGGLSDE